MTFGGTLARGKDHTARQGAKWTEVPVSLSLILEKFSGVPGELLIWRAELSMT
jgi:hypothetical protein